MLLKQLLINLPLCPLSNSAIKLKERCDTNLQEAVSVLYNTYIHFGEWNAVVYFCGSLNSTTVTIMISRWWYEIFFLKQTK